MTVEGMMTASNIAGFEFFLRDQERRAERGNLLEFDV